MRSSPSPLMECATSPSWETSVEVIDNLALPVSDAIYAISTLTYEDI